jgi:hypothetical protein
MSTLVYDDQLRVGNPLLIQVAAFQQHDRIFTAPDDEGRAGVWRALQRLSLACAFSSVSPRPRKKDNPAFLCSATLGEMSSSRFGGIVDIKATAKDNLPLICFDETIMNLGIKSIGKSDAFAN